MLLETAGLDATLRWLADQHQQRTGTVIQVTGHVGDVPGEVAVACFRVVQEALTNVVRHAGAQHVWIELSQSDGLLKLGSLAQRRLPRGRRCSAVSGTTSRGRTTGAVMRTV